MTATRIIVDWATKEISVGAGFLSGRFAATISLPYGFTIKGVLPMAITLTDTQFFTAAVRAVDARGNPGAIDGPVAWTVSDPTILAVVVVDGTSARFNALGPLGTVQVRADADADLGEGVQNITGTLDVEVVAGAAVALTIVPSQPQDQ